MDIKELEGFNPKEEREHWWIKTRFEYIDTALKFTKRKNLKLIEYGCGTAQNLWYLQNKSKFKNSIETLKGIDPNLTSDFKLDWTPRKVTLTNEFTREKGDMAIAMDVLEHIEDEKGALKQWSESLDKGGLLFITVPAFMSLWSYHDEFLEHKRRYTKKELINVLKEAGFEPVKVSYAFSFIFPLVYLIRKLSKGGKNQDLKLPPKPINWILSFLGKLENRLGGFNFFGTSVIGVFRKL